MDAQIAIKVLQDLIKNLAMMPENQDADQTGEGEVASAMAGASDGMSPSHGDPGDPTAKPSLDGLMKAGAGSGMPGKLDDEEDEETY